MGLGAPRAPEDPYFEPLPPFLFPKRAPSENSYKTSLQRIITRGHSKQDTLLGCPQSVKICQTIGWLVFTLLFYLLKLDIVSVSFVQLHDQFMCRSSPEGTRWAPVPPRFQTSPTHLLFATADAGRPHVYKSKIQIQNTNPNTNPKSKPPTNICNSLDHAR